MGDRPPRYSRSRRRLAECWAPHPPHPLAAVRGLWLGEQPGDFGLLSHELGTTLGTRCQPSLRGAWRCGYTSRLY
jgi:hypothetical protein